MATGKKSFIAYSDWKEIFDELPNEDAGALIKHVFAYVNDENPTSDSILIKAVFANIKTTLKRDLEKWDSQLIQRSEAGKRSAEKRLATKSNERSTIVNETARKSTDSVNVSVSDSVIVPEIKKKKTSVFVRPTFDDVKRYCDERKNGINPNSFLDSNDAKGWVTGKTNTPIKDWRAVIRTWENFRSEKDTTTSGSSIKRMVHYKMRGFSYTHTEKAYLENLQAEGEENIQFLNYVD